MSRSRRNSSNRRTPRNASRRMRIVHRSPRMSRLAWIEQVGCGRRDHHRRGSVGEFSIQNQVGPDSEPTGHCDVDDEVRRRAAQPSTARYVRGMADGVLEHDHDHEGEHAHRHMVHRHRDVTGGTARATVFGVSDGLVSNVALILGVAAAASDRANVLVAGVAGLLAGAASMAAGEYVSMKAQSELVERELEIERRSLRTSAGGGDSRARSDLSPPRSRRAPGPGDGRGGHGRPRGGTRGPRPRGTRGRPRPKPATRSGRHSARSSRSRSARCSRSFRGSSWRARRRSSSRRSSGLVAAATVGAVLASFTERSYFRTALRQVTWAVVACSATFAIGTWLGAVV